ncbi:hypothetical protein T11_17359 [Trichinella zimbabwensis]|uniref:Uncharacterized protein n=1 Tax=Trichinella zimbabwensis TaxID=268475 RepID=A0A0V1H659_9BILA|nr:hypothetical protein T11_17359 [Trichinella zimbabwensis]
MYGSAYDSYLNTDGHAFYFFFGSVIRVCCLCLPVKYSTLVPLTRQVPTSVAKWMDSHKVRREDGQLQVIHVNRLDTVPSAATALPLHDKAMRHLFSHMAQLILTVSLNQLMFRRDLCNLRGGIRVKCNVRCPTQ